MKNILYLIGAFTLLSIMFCSCKNEQISLTTPDITFSSLVFPIVEDDPISSVNFPVILSGVYDKEVSLDFATVDSTGIAGKDYVAILAGKLTFQPGETSKMITINILQDTAQKKDVFFKILLSNPVNGRLTGSSVVIKIINVDYTKLVWSDEFDDDSLISATWNYELGAGGWGNNELENYTNSKNNVRVDSGYLHIIALNPTGTTYTTGRITTKGKKEFTYGKVEIRAKLPEGKGIWPALWMLGGNISSVGWPNCGEIDIMELVGNTPSTVYGTAHWNNNGHVSRGSNFTLLGSKFSSNFHVFTLVWTPNRLMWLVDNQLYSSISRSEISTFPFDLPQFFIFNVAVGGNWPGNPDQFTVFPQNMTVDYIRIYK